MRVTVISILLSLTLYLSTFHTSLCDDECVPFGDTCNNSPDECYCWSLACQYGTCRNCITENEPCGEQTAPYCNNCFSSYSCQDGTCQACIPLMMPKCDDFENLPCCPDSYGEQYVCVDETCQPCPSEL